MSHKNLKMSKHNTTECQKCQNFNQKMSKISPKSPKMTNVKNPFSPPPPFLNGFFAFSVQGGVQGVYITICA